MTERNAEANPGVAEPQHAGGTTTTDIEIGARLSDLRRQHGMSIREVSRRSKVSPSLISEAERGLVEPSVGVLKRLAQVFDVTITYFFSYPGASGERVVRKDERRTLSELQGVTYELAGPDSARTMEPIFARLQPGAGAADQTPMEHEGYEWGMVLKGRLKVWVGTEVYFLMPEDSIYFASSIPHRVANASEGVTEYIWVNVPASF